MWNREEDGTWSLYSLTYSKHGGLDEVPPRDHALFALRQDNQPEEDGAEGHRDAQERLQLDGHRLAEALLEGERDLKQRERTD